MTNIKLCAAATALALVTATVSLTAAPSEAQAAQEQVFEQEAEQAAVLPAVAAVAVGGLVVAFAIGVAQGYMECKNGGTAPAEPSLADISNAEFDYVLN